LGYASALTDNAATSLAVIGSPYAKRALYMVNSVAPSPDKGAAGVAVALSLISGCKALPAGTEPSADASQGANWMFTQGFDTLDVSYGHVMTPNPLSCTGAESGFFGAQGNFPSDGSGGGWLGASTACSNHPGGVNVSMGDGSVKFIKDTISYQTWWALGTRNLGEVLSSDSY